MNTSEALKQKNHFVGVLWGSSATSEAVKRQRQIYKLCMWLPHSLPAVQAIQTQMKNPLGSSCSRLTAYFCDWQWAPVRKSLSDLCQQTLSVLISCLQQNQEGRCPEAQLLYWAMQPL